jgi:hypothetical protein
MMELPRLLEPGPGRTDHRSLKLDKVYILVYFNHQ